AFDRLSSCLLAAVPLLILSFLLYCSGAHRALHSFPTRRSSDLRAAGRRRWPDPRWPRPAPAPRSARPPGVHASAGPWTRRAERRSEEHTSELQSHLNLVCRLLLEKKKKKSEICNCGYSSATTLR